MNNDNFSAHGLIHSTLMPSRSRSVLSLLGDLMGAVYEVRAESAPGIPCVQFATFACPNESHVPL